MFHVRRRPADSQQRRRKKKPSGLSNGSHSSISGTEREGPCLIEVTHSGDGGRRVKLTSEPLEVSTIAPTTTGIGLHTGGSAPLRPKNPYASHMETHVWWISKQNKWSYRLPPNTSAAPMFDSATTRVVFHALFFHAS